MKIKLFILINTFFLLGNSVYAVSQEVDKSKENTNIIFSVFTTQMLLNIIFALIVVVLTYFLAKIFTSKITDYLGNSYAGDESGKEEIIGVLSRTVNITILSIGFALTLTILGIDMGIFLGGLGFGIGFTLKIFLTNFISGILMVTQGTFHNGDIIEISGKMGRIQRIYSLFTAVEQFNGIIFYVPNVKFLEDEVSNYNTNDKRRVDIEVGVDYSTDIVKAKKIMMQVVEQFPNILKAPEPMVIIDKLDNSSINLVLRFWIDSKSGKYFTTRSNVTETVNLAFRQSGITIPFPQLTLSNRENFMQDIKIK